MIKKACSYLVKSRDAELSKLGECGGGLTTVMKFLLEDGLVDGVLAVSKGADIYDSVPVLITEPRKISSTAGSLHCGTLNIAALLVKYLAKDDLKLAVTVKPCEARTIKELAIMGKLDLHKLILLGVNCGGTFPPVSTREMISNEFQVDPGQVTNEEIKKGKFIIEHHNVSKEISIEQLEEGVYGRRSNCRRCDSNIATEADVGFGNWGTSDSADNSFVEVFTERGALILERAVNSGVINVQDAPLKSIKHRDKINNSLLKIAVKWQEKDLDDVNDILSTFYGYDNHFKTCIKCMGCREACPICYCQECALDRPIPEWITPGAIPPSSLFHLERLIHMVESCTNCGQCEDVCPSDIPLSKIWHQIYLKMKDLKYSPGLNDEDQLLFELFMRPE